MNGSEELIDIFAKIRRVFPKLSKSHKKIALYIMSNYEKLPNMSAINLAKSVDVSEPTVTRFASFLGYQGYLEFRKALGDEVNSKLTILKRIEMSMKDNAIENVIDQSVSSFLKNDINSIRETLKVVNYNEFRESVSIIQKAPKVYIIGFRTTSILCENMGYYLSMVHKDVRVVSQMAFDIFTNLIKVENEDVVIGLSFPRYSQKTYDAVKFVKEKGAKIIIISDNEHAPVNEFADYKLIAKSNVYSFVDSLVAPLSLINALIVAVGFNNIKETKNTFTELEKIWKDHLIYTGDELSITLQENE